MSSDEPAISDKGIPVERWLHGISFNAKVMRESMGRPCNSCGADAGEVCRNMKDPQRAAQWPHAPRHFGGSL